MSRNRQGESSSLPCRRSQLGKPSLERGQQRLVEDGSTSKRRGAALVVRGRARGALDVGSGG